MTILVTGVCGFIGSNFINYMVNKYKNYNFIGIDALTYAGDLNYITDILNNDNFAFYKMNICNLEDLDKLFKDNHIDYCVNIAAETHVDRSIVDPSIFIKTNVLGVSNLLDLCLKYNVTRFHQVSTDEVNGYLEFDSKDLFREDSTLNPSSPYSASKASADLLVNAYHRTYKLDTTISRCSNNYGPNQYPEKLIPLVIKNSLNDIEIPIYGNGMNIREWLHVKDHVLGIEKILFNGRSGQVYNIGSNTEISNLELVKKILNMLGKSESLIKFVNDRPAHDLRYGIDYSKIKNELGYNPTISFNEGLEETIKYYEKKYK